MKKLICLILALVMVLSLVACGAKEAAPEKEAEATENPATEEKEPAQSGEAAATGEGIGDQDQNIVIALTSDISGFNPTANSNTEDLFIYQCIYDRLYESDENSQPIPHLAEEEIIISETERQYKIHQGAKFSDGTEIKASDVAASLNAAIESGIGGALFDPIDTVEAIDDYTVSIKTAHEYPQLTLALSHQIAFIMPETYLEAAKADPTLWSDPVCSGRYSVKSRTIGTSIELIPNEHFWDDATAAKNDSLTFKIVPEASTRTIMVQTGEADMCCNFAANDVKVVAEDPNVQVYSHESSKMFYIFLNFQNPIFNVKEVRQAMNYAIDREDIVLVQLDGHGVSNACYVAKNCYGWMDNPAGYEYDVEKAKELLAAGGYPDGFEFDMHCSADFNDAASLIQAQMAPCGIKMNIINVEQMPDIVPLVNQDQCEAGLVSWGCYPDDMLVCPRTLGESAIGSNNFARFVNEDLEKLWANGYTSDLDQRIEYYKEWQEILCEEAPWIPLYIDEAMVLANSNLNGVELNVELPFNFYNLTYK